MTKDHFFLGTPDCTDFVSGKVRNTGLPCPSRGSLPKSSGIGKKLLIFSSSPNEQFIRHCSKLQLTTP